MPGLHELKPARGSRRDRRRVGRGDGSGHGSYSGRGTKGQKARGKVRATFEGGQLPLVKRLPYMRGFHNPFRTEYSPVNLDRLDAFESGAEITPEFLVEKRIIRSKKELIKILGEGSLSKPLKVSAHAFSQSAREKIEAAGGAVTVIGGDKGETGQQS